MFDHAYRVCFTLSSRDEGEVEDDPLALHGVSLGDGVRDREDLELVGVADHDEDVQAPAHSHSHKPCILYTIKKRNQFVRQQCLGHSTVPRIEKQS